MPAIVIELALGREKRLARNSRLRRLVVEEAPHSCDVAVTLDRRRIAVCNVVVAAAGFHPHFRTRGGSQPDIALYQLALMVNAVVALVVLYGLAIVYRREPAVHGRFMLCTVFPLFTPITDRLIYANWPSLTQMVPTLDRVPLVQIWGFAFADVLLVALLARDWRGKRRVNAFAIALAVVVAFQASVLTFYRFDFWRSFAAFFLRLPLS